MSKNVVYILRGTVILVGYLLLSASIILVGGAGEIHRFQDFLIPWLWGHAFMAGVGLLFGICFAVNWLFKPERIKKP